MSKTALAFEALEEGGNLQRNVVFVSEMLEEVAPTLKEIETTPHTEFHPELILQDCAVSVVFRVLKNLEKRREEFVAND